MRQMFREGKPESQLEQLFNRGVKLINLGASLANLEPQGGLSPYFYRQYALVVGDRKYGLELVRERGTPNTRSPGTEYRDRLVVTFFPETQHNLKFVNSQEPSKLPTFEVYKEGDLYVGQLEFDKKVIKRVHWWSRFMDLIIPPIYDGTDITLETVGLQRGAERVLKNLNERLAGVPNSITAVNPELWQAKAARGYMVHLLYGC